MTCRLYFSILILLLLSFNAQLLSQQEDLEASLLLVDRYIASGEITKALTTIENILVKQPNNVDGQEKKISILTEQDRSKDAYNDVEDYMRMYPDQPEYFYFRALLHLQKGKYSKAIDDFNRAIQLDMPDNTVYKVYLNRGMAHFYLQDFDLAEDDFNEVLSLHSKSAAACHGKGMIKYELREYEEAVIQFQKALKLEDENPITHFNMAMTYFRLEEIDNACYHFNKSCSLGHRNACRLLMMECSQEIKISK
ncbi:Beta-barrel assembly-enhancing protease [subsurface metagenome]